MATYVAEPSAILRVLMGDGGGIGFGLGVFADSGSQDHGLCGGGVVDVEDGVWIERGWRVIDN